MTREEARAAWKAARAALDAIEGERRALLAPTQERYEAADLAVVEIEEISGYFVGYCEGCSVPIFDGDRHHSGTEVYLCESCAPSYEDMLVSPDHFKGSDDDAMSPAEAKAIVDAHIAAGGKVTDKLVSL